LGGRRERERNLQKKSTKSRKKFLLKGKNRDLEKKKLMGSKVRGQKKGKGETQGRVKTIVQKATRGVVGVPWGQARLSQG